PYGLVPWTAIADLVGVEMPLTNGFIDIINVVHGTDWRTEGCGAEELGIAGMGKEEVLFYVKTGERMP
ncbi:MAG: NAD/NADP octopine/nopaline dehydrogenase, partial [Blautia sp.]